MTDVPTSASAEDMLSTAIENSDFATWFDSDDPVGDMEATEDEWPSDEAASQEQADGDAKPIEEDSVAEETDDGEQPETPASTDDEDIDFTLELKHLDDRKTIDVREYLKDPEKRAELRSVWQKALDRDRTHELLERQRADNKAYEAAIKHLAETGKTIRFSPQTGRLEYADPSGDSGKTSREPERDHEEERLVKALEDEQTLQAYEALAEYRRQRDLRHLADAYEQKIAAVTTRISERDAEAQKRVEADKHVERFHTLMRENQDVFKDLETGEVDEAATAEARDNFVKWVKETNSPDQAFRLLAHELKGRRAVLERARAYAEKAKTKASKPSPSPAVGSGSGRASAKRPAAMPTEPMSMMDARMDEALDARIAKLMR